MFRWRSKAVNVYSVDGRSRRRDRPINCLPDIVLHSQTPDVIEASISPSKVAGDCSAPDLQTQTKGVNVCEGVKVCRGTQTFNERNIFTQLSLIVVVFMLGYLPTTIYIIWTTTNTSKRDPSFDFWFGAVSYLCLRISECLNPVIYNLGSRNIRRETKRLLKLD